MTLRGVGAKNRETGVGDGVAKIVRGYEFLFDQSVDAAARQGSLTLPQLSESVGQSAS
jgi:hypothetical protein